ncbi:MAG: class I SAM-dependent methyltransferase [Methanoregula sp.]
MNFFNIKTILSNPHLYSATMRLLGSDQITRMFVETYVQPKSGDHVLDIGCGPADILNFLPDVKFCGFDIDAGYIDAARKNFGNRGTFVCKPVSKNALDENSRFDLILAKGVLHHLNDIEATDMFELAQTHLNKGGRMITFDGCYVPGQSYFAKKFLAMDRGKYVRTKEAYMKFAYHSFSNVIPTIRHDLLRIPYTILIMECTQ